MGAFTNLLHSFPHSQHNHCRAREFVVSIVALSYVFSKIEKTDKIVTMHLLVYDFTGVRSHDPAVLSRGRLRLFCQLAVWYMVDIRRSTFVRKNIVIEIDGCV